MSDKNEKTPFGGVGTMQPARTARVKMLVVLAMLTAMAWILASVIRIPIVPAVGFLGYEPKDVLLVIAGFLYGPFAPLVMAALLSVIEMFTSSMTWTIGAIQNFISSVAFGCTAALIYRRWRTFKGAMVGLVLGTVLTTAVMMPSNYIFAPIFMGISHEAVAQLLLPGFLPFNLIKYGLNTALTLLLYKRIRTALSMARMLPAAEAVPTGKSLNVVIIIASLAIILVCVLFIIALRI